MGKGKEPEKGRDLEKWRAGFDEINWHRKFYCFECNGIIYEDDYFNNPSLYERFNDGQIRHKNNCNFN